MHRLAKLAAVLTLTLGARAGAQSSGFLVLLGTDTVQVERFERTAREVTGTIAYRSPRARIVRYTLRLDDAGRPAGYAQVHLDPSSGAALMTPPRATIDFAGDSLTLQLFGDTVVTKRVASPAGAVPMLGASLSVPFAHSFLAWEMAFAVARSRPVDSTASLYLIPPAAYLRNVGATRAWLIGTDSAEADYFRVARSGFRFDGEGYLLRADWRATTYKYVVTRVTGLDVEGLARRWAAEDAAGRGLGRYSPRDTVRASVDGASITIDYSRPLRRGREIWGALVPWNETWRLGADMATQLITDRDLRVGDVSVAAGRYSLWMLPGANGTELIINRQSGHFGTQYDRRQDLARVPMDEVRLGESVEPLTIAVGAGYLSVAWGDRAYRVPVVVARPSP